MTETWKSIPGYEGCYEASSEGRIRNIGTGRYIRTGRILKDAPDRDGYRLVTLCRDGQQRKHKVHRLVASAFLGPSDLFALHGDNNPANNRISNLRWGTALENANDRRVHGTISGWKERPSSCRRGHELTGENLRTFQRGEYERWECRECRRIHVRKYSLRKKAAAR